MDEKLYGVSKTEPGGGEVMVDEGPYTLQEAKSLALEYNGREESGVSYEARMAVDMSGE
jgi:hypothetical protein